MILQRLKNLWEFSKYRVETDLNENAVKVFPTTLAVKEATVNQRARFIPHIKVDPVKEITQENDN